MRSLARLIEMYRKLDVQDEARVIQAMRRASVREILADEALWGRDISHLTGAVESHFGAAGEAGA
jgi:hypothetical protein